MSEAIEGNTPTVFGVPLLELVRSFRGAPETAKAFIAAERYLLDVERLRTHPGESAGDLAAVREGIAALAAGPQYMDNPRACGAPEGWQWGYLPCGCRNDGYGNHVR